MFKRILLIGLALLTVAIFGLFYELQASLPEMEGTGAFEGLSAAAQIDSDELGRPMVRAANRQDALRLLGYLHARDRLFQMELMRRKSAGRLAELFGERAVALDTKQRYLQFERAAQAAVQQLPPVQQQALAAYSGGINEFLAQASALPPEFIMLGRRPENWRPEDCFLVAFGMFQTLTDQEQDERMLTVMAKALPADLVAFLTPDTDPFATPLTGGGGSRRPVQSIPYQAWAALGKTDHPLEGVALSESVMVGSNNWAVSGKKTIDGRALVANDMHLTLGLPNIWYQASLDYGAGTVAGLTLPGLPMVVAGSNQHVAWGFTNIAADVFDLVSLELNPGNAHQYATPEGWENFERKNETIHVKNAADVSIEIASTRWGPVSPQMLLGQPVAVSWTILKADGADFGLIDMMDVPNLEEAMAVMNRSGGPNQNVVLADADGHIAWTYLGRFPKRFGMDGASSRSWADGKSGWDGFIPSEQLPRLVDPPEGFIATANNRTLGQEYPHPIGHNYANGYRAFRIAQRLREMNKIKESEMLELQLDTLSQFYDFYQQLALKTLAGATRKEAWMDDADKALKDWDGHMNVDSLGIGLLVAFRQNLADLVFAPVVNRCRQVDPGFQYNWREMDTPLQMILTEKRPETLPDSRYADWQSLLQETLKASAKGLKSKYRVASLTRLPWGKINRIAIQHPISKAVPALSSLLDAAEFDSPGCVSACVRIMGNAHGASERMVVSPGHFEDGILHMPGGQSGHPLSSHYRDQMAAWQEGQALPFLSREARQTLKFVPANH